MTQIPAGWYPDPAAQQPGAAPSQRYWDGSQWTEHVHGAPYAAPQPGYGGPSRDVTPDGQRLAGWWRRVGAYLLDGIILGVLSVALGFPFASDIGAAYSDYFSAVLEAAEQGGQPPPQTDVLTEVAGPLAALVAISLAVNLVYTLVFLRTLAATPGKLALGMRVRLRDQAGPLSWGTILKRWIAQNVASFVGFVPVLSAVTSLYPLIDGLWPLWDDKRQALHDKFARTNVVMKQR